MKTAMLGTSLVATLVAFAVLGAGCGSSGGSSGFNGDAGPDGTTGGSSGGSSGSGSSSGASKDGSASGSSSGGASSSGGPVTCATPSTSYQMNGSAGSCGTFRWAVKTGTDNDVGTVNMTPQVSTVATLSKLPTITGPNCSRVTGEKQLYELKNITIQFERDESDNDYHLVLYDPASGDTMIGEIPYPGCVGHDSCQSGTPWLCEITRARAAIDAVDSKQTAGILGTGTVIGAGFFDTYEGMMTNKPAGMAPNDLELHPVLAVCIGQDCNPLAGY